MQSIWQEFSQRKLFDSLKQNIKTEVLIIGGGITGILTAYFLDKAGVNYALVEKGRICTGTTGNTTAKITVGHGLIYNSIIKSYGLQAAKMYLKANAKALGQYRIMCKNIDCDFEEKDNFVYSCDDRQKLENEMIALLKIGCNAQFCERIPIPVKAVGAIKIPKQAQFNPLKFLFEIAENLNIYENTFVREMIGTTAVTDSVKIHADKVIVATHFPFINKHGSYFLKLYQHRSYAVALKNAPELDGMYVDESMTGLSFRNYKDYLIIGGGDHRTGKNGGNWEELRRFYKEHCGKASEEFFWATQDCMSIDGIPYVGQYSKRTPNMFVASGFNKWGMTGAMLSAMLLCDKVIGKENEFSQVFNPSRSFLKPQLLINGLEATKNLLTPTTKRCPHLGCALKWNKSEHTWDCPCHGSRFSENGKLLDNPANGDIKI